jgi:hypothetical protein
MAVSSTRLELPYDEVTLTLHNESEKRLKSEAGNFQWFVYSGESWEFIVPKVSALVQPADIELQPGESREWTLHVNTGSLETYRPPKASTDARSFTFRLLPGTHAFGFRGTLEGSETATMYTTTVSVSGSEPSLTPSENVETHSRRGDTLTVTTRTKRETDDSHRMTLVLERESTTQKTATLSRFELYNPFYEQVRSYDDVFVPVEVAELLRDGFAFVKPADEQVRIQTVDTGLPRLGENESLFVTYGGATWKLTSRNGWK